MGFRNKLPKTTRLITSAGLFISLSIGQFSRLLVRNRLKVIELIGGRNRAIGT